MQLYQKLLQEMQQTHKDLFAKFDKAHADYVLDPLKYQDAFNSIGKELQEVIRTYERKLVGNTESGKYAKFSTNLSDKFWGAIRKIYPKIDFIGAKIS